MHPKFNMSAPQQSPQPLWFVSDFVRRTYFEYIGPLCPRQDDPTASVLDPGPGDEWPAFDAEKWEDAQSRSVLIANIILDEEKQFMCGGPFDFGPHSRDIARFMLGTPEPEELEGLTDRRPEVVNKMRKKG